MQCPYCAFQDTRVIDSRLSEEKNAIRRRRECLRCGKRHTTYECQLRLQLVVKKRDGSRERFERTKLRDGLAKACAKRPVPDEEIEYMVDDIEAELGKRRRREVPSQRLGDMALVRLRRSDMVSYLRFASVFRQYKDVEQFRSELVKLEGAAGRRT
jgi:transcriptional repressor NrdR